MGKNLRYKFIIGAILTCVAMLGIMTPVSAVNEGAKSTIIVSPMNQKIILTPGEEYSGVIKVSNPDTSVGNLDYTVSVGSFSQHALANGVDDYGGFDIESITTYNQITEWITLSQDNGSIAPGDTEELVYKVDVPEDAPAGGQYATIVFKNDSKDSKKEEGEMSAMVQENVQMASIIYAEVAGVTRNEGVILENSVPAFLFSSILEATSMVRNNGNVHTNAEYILQVWPLGSDEEICTNEENISKEIVLPETQKFHTEACQLPAVGIFRAKQTVKIFGETSIAEKTVIICPIWLLFIIIFVVFALVFYFVAKVKARKKAAKKAEKSA